MIGQKMIASKIGQIKKLKAYHDTNLTDLRD